MRNIVLPLAAVLVGAAALWLVLGADRRETDGVEVGPDGTTEYEDSATLIGGGSDDGATRGAKKAKGSSRPGLDPRSAPRGDLTVFPVDPDGQVLPIDSVKVRMQSAGLRWPTTPLAHPNRETNGWEFKQVFAGDVQLVITGDTIRDTVANVRITVREQPPLDVTVHRAGGIHFVVKHDDGTPANELTLELFKGGHPVSAWYQERHRTRLTSRKRMRQAKLGHAGYITGLDKGSYTLRATNKDGYYREGDVDVNLGEVSELRLEVRSTADAPSTAPAKETPEPPPPPPPERVERHPDLPK